MKLNNFLNPNYLLLFSLILIFSNCSRDKSDDAVPATFPANGAVYIDGFSGGLEYLPFGGSFLEAFTVDEETKYAGNSAMRFDVPNESNLNGNFAGAIFPDYGMRDLSGFNALTFWAKATQSGTINEIGFGQDFRENTYQVTLNNLELTTNWRQYTIVIPDPSKLTQESGLFWYAEGPEDGDGYTFWIDELQFEQLGTITQPRPAIFNGEDTPIDIFVGATNSIAGLTQTVNLGDEQDQTINVAPAYFEFSSSNPSVATVNEQGVITAVGVGEAVITATLSGIEATGSAQVSVQGAFVNAPTPTQDPSNVISIFSDAYTNEPVDYFNGFWQPNQTTLGNNEINVGGDNLLSYTELNFVGIQFAVEVPTINAAEMTHFHIDVQPREAIDAGDYFIARVIDAGPDGVLGTDNESSGEFRITSDNLVNGEWYSLDIPIGDLPGLTNRNNLAQIVFVTDATISSVYIDNIYFYNDGSSGGSSPMEPTMAAQIPTQAAADVISMFSNAYNDVNVNTWRTDWSAANLEDIQIQGDDVRKYTALDFVGIETVGDNLIDASSMTHFRMDIWTPNLTTFRIKIVDFGADRVFDGGDDTEHELIFESPVQGQWFSYDIPLSDFEDLVNPMNIAQLILSGLPAGGGTLYIDNVYFYNDGSSGGSSPMEPTMAAPTPTQAAADVISMFSNAYDDVNVNTWRTDWSAANLEDIQIQGDDVRKYTALDFVGIETVGDNLIDASFMTHFRMDIWTPNLTTFRIKIVDFGADRAFDGGDDTEHELIFESPVQGQWFSYDIPLSDFEGLVNPMNIAQFILSGLPAGGGTLYIDNVYFYNDGSSGGSSPMEPTMAAPTPTQSAADVISMFSNAYDDVNVNTWRTDWSAANLEDIQIQGDDVRKYTALDFVGIETVGDNLIDASSMTHFRMDIWTPNLTTFRIKIVDFGADRAFDGGDDTEHELIFESPVQGQWFSYDIPLSDFEGLVNPMNIAQFILSGLPTGEGTLYVDNVYFYKQ